MKFDYIKWLGILFSTCLLFFLFHSFLDYFKVYSEIKYLDIQLNNEKCKRFFLSKNIEKFAGPEIDYDLLETQARNIIAYVNESETTVFWKEHSGRNLNVYYGKS